MTIPAVNKDSIYKAIDYIDKNGVPLANKSTKYELVMEDGKRYPPKYVVAVAHHLENNAVLTTNTFNAIDARNYLKKLGFTIEEKQQKYQLTITADHVESTDDRFTIDNIYLGDNYKPLDVFYEKADGDIITRDYAKGERRNSNRTMPLLALQVFEKEIASLPVEDRESFPICRYKPGKYLYHGIYRSVEEFRKNNNNTIEYLTYNYDNGRQFVIYGWNIFSTILFVQECLKRFGEPGDKFVLTYRDKTGKEEDEEKNLEEEEKTETLEIKEYRNPFSPKLISSKNVIFHGAPGTGKSYLAREIAADIVSDGYFNSYDLLTDEQKEQVEFVQFHPSYDYSDFVEGLRPKINTDGTMGFELKNGIFKSFVDRARKNYENSQKSPEAIKNENSVQETLANFFSGIEFGIETFKTVNGNEFTIDSVDDAHIQISIPGNAIVNHIELNLDEIRKMLESGQNFEKVKDVTSFFNKTFATQGFSYDLAIFKAIREKVGELLNKPVEPEQQKKYVFIIDEINRGEISKIFGELFFAIDPGYRGTAGEISTQYSNLHSDPNEKFYIPDNVYIVGTMNDIDRSVDSFDFAMRRRFRFIDLKADECLEILDSLENDELKEEAIRRMTALNKEIAAVEDLNENYQIGAAYFLKLKSISFDQLWEDYLQPLLKEYVQGMYNENDLMDRFAKAYGYQKAEKGNGNENSQNQG